MYLEMDIDIVSDFQFLPFWFCTMFSVNVSKELIFNGFNRKFSVDP